MLRAEKKGIAIIPRGIEKFSQLKTKVKGFDSHIISFGEEKCSDVRISNIEVSDNFITSRILDQERNVWNLKLKAAGKHYIKNAAALLTLVSSLNLSLSEAIVALERWTPLAGRGQVSEIKFKNYYNNISIHLIDETYNANPGSVKSSLETLVCIFPNKKNQTQQPRRIAVLGDMLELGFSEVKEHINISKFASLDKIDKIFCVGTRMRKLYDVLPYPKRGVWTETALEMQNVLVNKLNNGDIIMVKGSFSMGMNTIVNKLKTI